MDRKTKTGTEKEPDGVTERWSETETKTDIDRQRRRHIDKDTRVFREKDTNR